MKIKMNIVLIWNILYFFTLYLKQGIETSKTGSEHSK